MFNATKMRRRAGSFLFGGGSLLLAAALVLINPGLIPGVEATTPPAQSCNVTYFALDPANPLLPNPAKEVPAAFGPEVTVRGEDPVKAELNERRECGADGMFDPALTASHYSAWSEAGLTEFKVAFTEIDAFYAKIAADKALYNQVLTELKNLENASAYSEEGVSAGIWSLYMDPNGAGGVNVKQGRTGSEGTNAVFTSPSGAVIKYRLDCGFQVNRDGEFPGVPQCTPENCPPPPPPTCPPGTTGTPPDCYTLKFQTPTTTEPGWDQRGTDNGVTDGQQSADQITSGETRGNAVNDQVDSGTTNGSTTKDTKPSESGGPVAEDATVGGDNHEDDVQDEELVNDDSGGTTGGTCVPTAFVSC